MKLFERGRSSSLSLFATLTKRANHRTLFQFTLPRQMHHHHTSLSPPLSVRLALNVLKPSISSLVLHLKCSRQYAHPPLLRYGVCARRPAIMALSQAGVVQSD